MAILFQDDFNRANEELGVSPNWTTEGTGETLDIVSNEVKRDGVGLGSSSFRRGYVNGIAARADMNVQVNIKRESGAATADGRAIIGRRVDGTNFYYWKVTDVVGGTISKNVGGVRTTLVATTDPVIDTVYHTYRFEVFGTLLRAYYDGTLVGSVTDSSITAAGFAGIEVEGRNKDSFYDDFAIGDTAGSFVPANFDKIIPLMFRRLLEAALSIPIQWNMCKIFASAFLGEVRLGEFNLGGDMHCAINIDQLIPVLWRLQLAADQIIPVQWGEPQRLLFDLVIALLIRRAEAFDKTIPISWSQVDLWIKQAVSEADVWVKQSGSEADSWTKQTGSEADAWTKQGGSDVSIP